MKEISSEEKDRVFLCVGTDWDGHLSSMVHLFSVIARDYPVIWINSMGQRAPRFSPRDLKRVMQKARGMLFNSGYRALRPTHERGMPRAVIEPRVIPYHQFRSVRSMNSWLLSRQLSRILRRSIGPDTELLFVTCNPAAVDLVGRFDAALSIYYCMDEYAEMPDSDPALIRACESLMLGAVDCTFATSQHLSLTKTAPHYRTLHFPQAVDFQHFQYAGPCPAPLAHVPRPIVGFQGIIGDRIDLVLFEKILRAFPHASLVALGPQEADLSKLKRYPNFFAPGAVSYDDLPAWASQFDIGLIAYVQDRHTSAVNPLKLLEYLAMGQQVVSVDLPELARFRSWVHVAQDHDMYIEAVAKLLARYPFSPEDKARQRQAARGESWATRAGEFLAACDELLQAKRGRQGAAVNCTGAARRYS